MDCQIWLFIRLLRIIVPNNKRLSINDALEFNVIHPEDYDLDGTYSRAPLGLITTD